MTMLAWIAAIFATTATLLHLGTTGIAVHRFRHRGPADTPPLGTPPISIVRPLCGIDAFDELTLRSTFELDYPAYEVILCVASAHDPAVPLARRLISENGHVPARLLIGDDRISANPKLNNVVKGWKSATHEWIVIADSNVLMPRDYLSRLLSAWLPGTGLVCSPPVASHAAGLWAHIEAAFLNGYQARWQYAAHAIGMGFAQGKTMLWQRSMLERAGGIGALARDIAEDAAATKVVREAGMRVRLVDSPFAQPLGRRSAAAVWKRQLRWARLRRSTFPAYFVPELLTGALPPLICSMIAAAAADIDPLALLIPLALLWYGAEAVLAHAAGWQLTLLSPVAWMLRDAALPVLWVQAWLGNGFEWRGNAMSVSHGEADVQRGA